MFSPRPVSFYGPPEGPMDARSSTNRLTARMNTPEQSATRCNKARCVDLIISTAGRPP